MSEQEVVDLMKSSNSEDEWTTNCDVVKEKFGGYPDFWYTATIASGLVDETRAKWGDTGPLFHIRTISIS